MIKIVTFIFLILPALGCIAQEKTTTYLNDPSSNPPELIVTLNHIRADVSFKPEINLVIATTEFAFTTRRYQTDSIIFYCPGFTFLSLKIYRKNQDTIASLYKQQGDNLIIYPSHSALAFNTEYRLSMSYTAQPESGAIYFIGWRPEESGKRKEIWAHRPHGWLPYIDARITMDMFYTFDKHFNVFANGERIEVKDNPDSTKTWHYRMAKDHPFFSTSVVIGEYDFKSAVSRGGVPLEFWYYRGQEDKVLPTYQYTETMIDFLSDETGTKYPYQLYRQAPVIDYMYGAMETTTSTVFGDFIFIDPHAFWQRNYINTNAHEMAHQWFGNCIAHLVNKDVWLTESFATYYAKMFEKSLFGKDYYQNIAREELNQALTAARTNNYPVGSSLGGNARIYQKGSLVLGMLHNLMGDREFKDGIKLYLQRYSFGYAQTNDLMRCLYDATGKSWSWFFDEWIMHGGEPDYKVSYTVLDDTTGLRSTYVTVTQTQETNDLTGLFRMPVKLEVHYKDTGCDSITAWISDKTQVVVIPNRERKPITFVLFDPGRKVVKKVSFIKSFGELAAQAANASEMIDRYDALVAMRNLPVTQKQAALMDVYRKETFHLTKSEIIEQLSLNPTHEVIGLLRQALTDTDASVRKAVLTFVNPLPPEIQPDAEKALQDYSYLNQELALQNLCQSFPDKTLQYLDQTKALVGWRGMNIRMKWLEIAINAGLKEYLPELIAYTGPKYEFETRINAFTDLKRLRYIDDVVLTNARTASHHWNYKLSGAAREYLAYFGK